MSSVSPDVVNLFNFYLFVAFGFCEYKEPESTLRALRLLHELQVGDKKLLVKVDAKTKAQLETWKASQRRRNGVRCPPGRTAKSIQYINQFFLFLKETLN